MTEKNTTNTETIQSAGRLLNEAAAALRSGMDSDPREWHELTFNEQAKWGMHVAGPVMATLILTKPEGWHHLFNEVQAIANAWVRHFTPHPTSVQIEHPEPLHVEFATTPEDLARMWAQAKAEARKGRK